MFYSYSEIRRIQNYTLTNSIFKTVTFHKRPLTKHDKVHKIFLYTTHRQLSNELLAATNARALLPSAGYPRAMHERRKVK